MREGKGKYMYENGDYYDGGWKEDVREGYGELFVKDFGLFKG